MDIYTVMGNYTSSWLVQFLHSWPHVAFNLELVPEYDYTYDNLQYLESLAVIALFSVIWLLISMVVFAIYFCCFKGSKPNSKYSSNGCYCSLCLLLIFIMFSLAWVGVGVYGNLQANDGLKVATKAVKRGNEIFATINEKMLDLQDECLLLSEAGEEMVSAHKNDIDAIYLAEFIEKYSSICNQISSQTHGVNDRLQWAVGALGIVEFHRNIVTHALLGFQLLICLMAMMGLCCRSKVFLTLTIVLGILCVTVTYFHLGLDLIVNTATADFCINPYVFVQNETVAKNYMTYEAAMYYLECAYNSTNPFEILLQEGQVLLSESQEYINENINNESVITNIENTKSALESAETTLTELSTAIDCRQTKQELVKFIPSVCEKSLEGFAILSAAMFAVGVCLSLAMCAAAKVGKQYGRKRHKRYTNEEFNDPFLPPLNNGTNGVSHRPTMTTHTNNPLYGTSSSNFGAASNTLSIFRGSDEDVSTPLEQPPPYSPPRPDSHYNSMS